MELPFYNVGRSLYILNPKMFDKLANANIKDLKQVKVIADIYFSITQKYIFKDEEVNQRVEFIYIAIQMMDADKLYFEKKIRKGLNEAIANIFNTSRATVSNSINKVLFIIKNDPTRLKQLDRKYIQVSKLYNLQQNG